MYPEHCAFSTPCKIHVVLHGCGMNHQLIGKEFIVNSGFGQYAFKNDLILLFPQVSHHWLMNQFACWDFGLTTASLDEYDTNKAYQPKAIQGMVKRLTSPKDELAVEEESFVGRTITYIGHTFFRVYNHL